MGAGNLEQLSCLTVIGYSDNSLTKLMDKETNIW